MYYKKLVRLCSSLILLPGFVFGLVIFPLQDVFASDNLLKDPILTIRFKDDDSNLTSSDNKQISSAIKSKDKESIVTVVGYSCYINSNNENDISNTIARQRARSIASFVSDLGFKNVSTRSFSLSCSDPESGRKAEVFVGKNPIVTENQPIIASADIKPSAKKKITKQVTATSSSDDASKQVTKSDAIAYQADKSAANQDSNEQLTPGNLAQKDQETIKQDRAYIKQNNPPIASEEINRQNISPTVNLDFVDADIKSVIKAFANLTKKNFVIDDKVRGKITIVSPREVSISEAFKVLESALEVHGYALSSAGEVIKVIPSVEAVKKGSFKIGDAGDSIETRLVPIKRISAKNLVSILRPLIPSTGFLTVYEPSNTLIITDFASNIAKITNIIERLDSVKHKEIIKVIRLRHADAKEIINSIKVLFSKDDLISIPDEAEDRTAIAKPGLPATQPAVSSPAIAPVSKEAIGAALVTSPKITFDIRTNSIIIMAPAVVANEVVRLIKQLDLPPSTNSSGINVYYLKNASAEELSKVLNTLTKSAGLSNGSKVSSSTVLNGDISITPDVSTNSLLITASSNDYEILKDVIRKLDIRRRQVFVESLILEVTASDENKFGIEWRFIDPNSIDRNRVAPFGGTTYDNNIGNVSTNPIQGQPKGLSIGVITGSLKYNGISFLNLGALLTALKTDSDVNVISTPNIMTSDNQEAEIVVASEVPLEGQTTVTAGGNTVTSIERKNVGLTLKIKPQITESEDLKLTLYQEISSIAPTQLDKARDIITNKRSIKSTLVVRDKQNIVVGGLIRHDGSKTSSRVPILGKIPILGYLFSSQTRKVDKTNLMVFLTPHIIRRSEDSNLITNDSAARVILNDLVGSQYDEYIMRSRGQYRQREDSLDNKEAEEKNRQKSKSKKTSYADEDFPI